MMEHLMGQGDFDYSYVEVVTAWREANYHTFSRRSPYNRDLMDANSAAEVSAEWDSAAQVLAEWTSDMNREAVTSPRDTILALLETMPHTFRELAILSGLNGKQLNACLAGLFREGLIHKCTGSYTYMLTSQLDTASGPSTTADLERQLNIDVPAVQTLAQDIEAVECVENGQRVQRYYSRELDEHADTPEALRWLKGFLS